MSAILAPERTSGFTEYPEAMDKYFVDNQVDIFILPTDIIPDIENTVSNIRITSSAQLCNYLEEEISFWEEKDKKKTLKGFTHIDALKSAKDKFEQAHSFYQSNSDSTGLNYLKQCINYLNNGALYSKSDLAKFLLKYVDENPNFIQGIKIGLLKNRNTILKTTAYDVEGFIIALSYRGYVETNFKNSEIELNNFKSNLKTATDSYASLNEKYTTAFHEQENRINNITNQTNMHLQDLENNILDYFSKREERCNELEQLYEEKLKLQAPAQYWDEMENEYTKKGRVWLAFSIILTIIIVGGLITTLALIPNIFSEASHWIDVLKNSAIITVITSIAVYILRLFVKVTISSFHLSRDAKERSKLTYFYLALIERKAVSEKERAIILNSLFSRADTGLLKGDSTPAMSSNVVDLIDTLGKN